MSTPLKAIFGGSVGNLIEWYDWYAYSTFTLYFAQAFFPKDGATAQLLNTAAIFAVGFLMRPIGGFVFGRYADKKGRRTALSLSVLLMSAGSLMIACTPTYATIGVAAPVVLTLARLLQGLSVGGEYGASATYLSEVATSHRRGLFSSFQYVTLIMGQLLSLLVQLLLQRVFLSPAEIERWGWRIPFFIGAALAVVALYLRRGIEETEAFTAERAKPTAARGTMRELARHPRAILLVVGLTLGGTLAFYTYTTYMQKFLVNTAGFRRDDATLLSLGTLSLSALVQPVFGALSDRVGRRPLLIGFGLCGTAGTVPIMTALSHTTHMGTAFALMMLSLLIVSGYTSINALVKAELFPTEVRALGVALPYALTVSLFGGSAEYVALWFKQAGREPWFYWYVTGCIFASLVVYLFMGDTKKMSRIDEERDDVRDHRLV